MERMKQMERKMEREEEADGVKQMERKQQAEKNK